MVDKTKREHTHRQLRPDTWWCDVGGDVDRGRKYGVISCMFTSLSIHSTSSIDSTPHHWPVIAPPTLVSTLGRIGRRGATNVKIRMTQRKVRGRN